MAIAYFGRSMPRALRLTIDAFCKRALMVDGLVEGVCAVECHLHATTNFPIGIFLAAIAFEKLEMVTGFSRRLRHEQWTTKALRTIAVGMIELEGRHHAQALAADGNSIPITRGSRIFMLIERDGSNPPLTSGTLVDVPGIKSRIGGGMRGVLIEGDDRLGIDWDSGQSILCTSRYGLPGMLQGVKLFSNWHG
jgi:hypothetical protein